jgi:predicted CopG family antitoxin
MQITITDEQYQELLRIKREHKKMKKFIREKIGELKLVLATHSIECEISRLEELLK